MLTQSNKGWHVTKLSQSIHRQAHMQSQSQTRCVVLWNDKSIKTLNQSSSST